MSTDELTPATAQRRPGAATTKPLRDTADTVLAMAMLWVIPVVALLLALTRV